MNSLLLLACIASDKESDTGSVPISSITADISVVSDGMSDVMDAATDPTGDHTYFTAASGDGFGVFEADGGTGTLIVDGFGSARNLVVDAHSTIYVGGSRDGKNGVFSVSIPRKSVEPRFDSSIFQVQGLDLLVEDEAEVVYISAYSPKTEKAAVWWTQVPAGDGGSVPGNVKLTSLGGIAKASSGVYVVGEGKDKGTLIRMKDEDTSVVVTGLTLGTPAGIALTVDESTLLVSALSEQHTSELVVVNLEDATIRLFRDVIGENVGSGGIHRANDANVFVWAGTTSDNIGKVYRLDLQ